MPRGAFTAILLSRVVANLAAVSSFIHQRRFGVAVLQALSVILSPLTCVVAAAAVAGADTAAVFCSSGRRSRKRSPAVAAGTTSWWSSHTLL